MAAIQLLPVLEGGQDNSSRIQNGCLVSSLLKWWSAAFLSLSFAVVTSRPVSPSTRAGCAVLADR
jgi:hypothetical protein